jgi:hypothetical protein
MVRVMESEYFTLEKMESKVGVADRILAHWDGQAVETCRIVSSFGRRLPASPAKAMFLRQRTAPAQSGPPFCLSQLAEEIVETKHNWICCDFKGRRTPPQSRPSAASEAVSVRGPGSSKCPVTEETGCALTASPALSASSISEGITLEPTDLSCRRRRCSEAFWGEPSLLVLADENTKPTVVVHSMTHHKQFNGKRDKFERRSFGFGFSI